MINVELKGGTVKEFESGVTPAEIAKSIGMGLYKSVCCARVDGNVVDLRTPITKDCRVDLLTFDEPDGKKAFWHTASHILAQAVKRLYPSAKCAIGPAVDNGFYYDFEVEKPFTSEDLEKIKAEMKKIVKSGIEIERFELAPDEAVKMLEEMNEPYKVELAKEHSDNGEHISFYKQGDFTDLCAGPHLMSVAPIKAVELTNCTGAYWRGDEHNQMLTRLYATAFAKKDELEAYITMMEEAKKRDHRKLGKELGLFMMHEAGPGFPFFLPKGMVLKNTLLDYWREIHRKAGYVEISTPVILNRSLWETSGHWDHYKENMYFTQIDEEDYAVKPMNCPGGILYYKTNQHSYRELPKRVGEFGIVHRHELHGALHGLFRVRVFTQDDAHIFMTQDQMKDEVIKTMEMYRKLYSVFGLEYHVELSTRPENSMGSEELWEISTNALRDAVEAAGVPYVINEGDGAFYGPKLDFHIKDCLGRTWQCGTIQMDMQLPERFDVNYVGEDGEKHRAVMLHRAGYGSLERFIGILIEHFAGAFPSWIAPVQVKVVPVTEKHMNYARSVADALSASNVRVEIEEGNDTLGYKIRKAQMEKVPYTLVVGDKEMNGHTVSVRSRKNGDEGSLPVAVFVSNLIREIRDRSY